jgi:autotransporter-associated beta strand protein
LTNYDADRQTFTAGLSLGSNQYWDVGTGGVTAGNIATNGNLLEFGGAGTVILNGVVSGAGGLALSGERLEVTGTSTYTGGTWVHDGELNVSGDLSASSGVEVGAYGTVAGSGVVAGLSGSGLVSPGNSPGILTTSSIDPTGGLDFQFEFTALGGPDYTDAAASIQDVLRITDASPFSSSLSAANTVEIYLDVAGVNDGDTYQGGFFTDTASDFLGQISGADFQYYLATPGGSVSYNGVTYELYSGPLSFELSTVADTADFAGGSVDGQVMQFVVVPEMSSLALAGVLGVCALVGMRFFRG